MNKDISKDEHVPSQSTTVQSAHLALSGQTKGLKRLLPFLGPAFIASVAYIDPG
ncbi:divalent metal cation transporter, partial [Klebsiella pneumoniae]|nr:divalent metal cation transporter [Klebsiella pneumoniae]